MPYLIELVVSWIPVLIFVGVPLVVMRRSNLKLANIITAQNQDVLVNNRRVVALLEEISVELKQRNNRCPS